jgi:hypothetical protein
MSHNYTYNIYGKDYTVSGPNLSLDEIVTHCHKPDCSWLTLTNLTQLKDPPPLLPNPELSGIGVSQDPLDVPPDQFSDQFIPGDPWLLHHSVPHDPPPNIALPHSAQRSTYGSRQCGG